MSPDRFEWRNPYRAPRTPVLGRNVIAASQPLAAQAGVRMMLRGGNAVDAAIAAAVALTVVEPTMNGVGGDAFALVWDGGRLYGLNGSGRAPRAWTPELFAGCGEMPAMGWGSVTVPGAVSAWVALSRRFGILPFRDLFQPAIEYAERGYPVSPLVARTWAEAAPKYHGFESFVRAFLPGGRPPDAGSIFRCPELAATLTEIAETFGESFYRGGLAARIAAFARETGGLLGEDDLALHSADWVESVTVDFDGFTLHEIPPNSQAVAASLALALLKRSAVRDVPPDSAESIDLQARAMYLAHRVIRERVADPEYMENSADALLSEAFVADLCQRMNGWPVSRDAGGMGRVSGDTVYLTSADDRGMMVSFIQSNYFDFGSGLVVPGTGISLHSRGACFSLDQNHANSVAGGKRPFHTLCPAFVTEAGRPVMSFGVMGGPMQPQGHVQTFLRVFVHGQNPQAACDAPRWHVAADGSLMLEPGFPEEVYSLLAGRGHTVERREYGDAIFGGGQFALALPHGYCAASDSRKDGLVAAW